MPRTPRGGTQNALDTVGEDAHDILDFFDMVGLLVHQHAADLKMAWNDLAVWMISYWRLLGGWVRVNRHGDNTLWNEYAWLYGKVLPIEASARKISGRDAANFYDTQAPALLQRESQLKPRGCLPPPAAE